MAIKDPKAQRAGIRYPKGRVVGALGLLEAIFGTDDIPSPAEVKIDRRGRRRLVNLARRSSAVGGKQVIINLKTGESYQLHYSGTFIDFVLGAVPKMNRGVVLSYSTARGSENLI